MFNQIVILAVLLLSAGCSGIGGAGEETAPPKGERAAVHEEPGDTPVRLEGVRLITEGSEVVQSDGNHLVMLEYHLTVRSSRPIAESVSQLTYRYIGHSAELVPVETDTFNVEALCKQFSTGNCVEKNGVTTVRVPLSFAPGPEFDADDLAYLKKHLEEMKFDVVVDGASFTLGNDPAK